MKLRTMLPAALVASGLLIAGCGNDGQNNTEQNTAEHNKADVEFATSMIPHHGQAIEMADIALDKATNAEVERLAKDIKAAQDPEIEQMSTWLRDWDEPVPDVSTDPEHAGHESMEGMMGADDMGMLEDADGSTFDKHWVEMMIEHHEGAITMSETELEAGSAQEAKLLAQAIIDGQSKEIETMQALLPELG